MRISALICGAGAVALLLASCTERRTASDPEPNGETVEVVIPEDSPLKNPYPVRVIDITPEDSIPDSIL